MGYQPHSHHRDGNPKKSQWIISIPQERVSFAAAAADKWLDETTGWGLHRDGDDLDYLGKDRAGDRRLFVAKFVRGRKGENWHGYPADHQRSPADIPSKRLRREWLQDEVLPAPKIRRLSRGQPCGL
jgi:hypothetical protein